VEKEDAEGEKEEMKGCEERIENETLRERIGRKIIELCYCKEEDVRSSIATCHARCTVKLRMRDVYASEKDVVNGVLFVAHS